MSDTEEFIIEQWTYQGRTPIKGGKLGHSWMTANANDFVSSKAPKFPIIGGLYEVRCTPDRTSAYIASAKYLGYAQLDESLIQDMKATSLAYEAEHDAEKLKGRLAKENNDIEDMTLRQIREMMLRRRGHALRSALLAAVIEAVMP